MLLRAVMSIAAGVLVVWLVLLACLLVVRPRAGALTESVRLLPDLLRLVARLARDDDVPGRVRLLLWLLLAYVASPIDLVPDFIPVLGYADDAIAVTLVLRLVVRSAGTDSVDRHWPGSPAGLRAVHHLAGSPTG